MCSEYLVLMIFTYLHRRGPGQEFVKSSLGDTIKQLVSYDGSMEIDPLKVSSCSGAPVPLSTHSCTH